MNDTPQPERRAGMARIEDRINALEGGIARLADVVERAGVIQEQLHKGNDARLESLERMSQRLLLAMQVGDVGDPAQFAQVFRAFQVLNALKTAGDSVTKLVLVLIGASVLTAMVFRWQDIRALFGIGP